MKCLFMSIGLILLEIYSGMFCALVTGGSQVQIYLKRLLSDVRQVAHPQLSVRKALETNSCAHPRTPGGIKANGPAFQPRTHHLIIIVYLRMHWDYYDCMVW